MKYRLCFVTNSSSSSFLCDVCGNIESGYDLSLSDFDMYQCTNSHIFHDHEMIGNLSAWDYEEVVTELNSRLESYKDRFEKSKSSDWLKSTIARLEGDIAQLKAEPDDEGLLEEITEKYELNDSYVSPKYCPICQLKEMTDSDIITYLYKKSGLGYKALLKKVKENFSTYEELKTFLKGE